MNKNSIQLFGCTTMADNTGYNNECDNCVCSSCKGNICESVNGCCYNCDNCSGDGTRTDDKQNNRWTSECDGYECNLEL